MSGPFSVGHGPGVTRRSMRLAISCTEQVSMIMVQSGPVSDTYKLAYQMNVTLAVQQISSRFMPGFTYHADLKGRQMQMLDLILPHAAIIDGPRGGDTPNVEQIHEPVWVRPRQVEDGKLIEKEDYIKALTDYQSPYVQGMAAAVVRARDQIFAAALTGARIIGLDGATTSNYTAPATAAYAGTVAATVGSADGATDTGMNVRKLNRVDAIWRSLYVDNLDGDERWVAVNAVGMAQLFNDIVTINTDFRKMAELDTQTRTVQRVAGFNITSFEGIADTDATHYTAVAWLKSGMHYGDFSPLVTDVAPNPAKKYRPHIYLENWFGATRSEDARVIKISNFKNMTGPNA